MVLPLGFVPVLSFSRVHISLVCWGANQWLKPSLFSSADLMSMNFLFVSSLVLHCCTVFNFANVYLSLWFILAFPALFS
jgi:hypothetical protein